MPGGFPLGLDVCNNQGIGLVAQASSGAAYVPLTYVNFSGTANTKGSWTQLAASISSDVVFVFLQLFNNDSITGCVDIGIGASGSEVAIVNNLAFSEQAASNYGQMAAFPLAIPSGSRVAARAQASTASTKAATVGLVGYDGAFTQIEGGSGVDAIGFSTATSKGTAVTPGFGTKGSYSQLTASTSRDYIGLFLTFDAQDSAPVNANQWLDIDLAIGAGGSEIVIINDITINLQSESGFVGPATSITPFFPINIPAGTRIAARASVYATANAPTFGVSAYGVYL